MPVKLTVFVVDDHPIVREGVKRTLERQPNLECVGEAADGCEATALVPRARPDIVLLDIAMPGIDGVQTARLLKNLCPRVKIIALTIHDEQRVLREIFEAGASGFVLKRASPDELLQAIRTVSANGVYVDSRLTGHLLTDLLHLQNGQAHAHPRALTDREELVLKRIAQGYSNKEIASELRLSIKTVETYKTRAMDKLDLRHRVDIVRHAIHAGWLSGKLE